MSQRTYNTTQIHQKTFCCNYFEVGCIFALDWLDYNRKIGSSILLREIGWQQLCHSSSSGPYSEENRPWRCVDCDRYRALCSARPRAYLWSAASTVTRAAANRHAVTGSDRGRNDYREITGARRGEISWETISYARQTSFCLLQRL